MLSTGESSHNSDLGRDRSGCPLFNDAVRGMAKCTKLTYAVRSEEEFLWRAEKWWLERDTGEALSCSLLFLNLDASYMAISHFVKFIKLDSYDTWALMCVLTHFSPVWLWASLWTLCNPLDHSPPGSSVHGILQARILGWVAMPSSRGSSWPRDRTWVSYVSCMGKWVLYY